MGISGTIGALSGLFGVGSGIAGLVGGSPAQNVQIPQSPWGQYQGGAAGQAYGGTQGLGQFNLYDPSTAGNLSYGIVNNPYAGGYQAGAGTAGQLGQAGALNAFGAGGNLYGGGSGVLNTAFDPQSALYARTLQQVTDQSNAANAMAGVATTPYGAGITGQNLTNFNIDWQNQQLGRQLAGLQGAGGAYGEAAGMQAQAPMQYLQGSGLPYGTANTIAQTGLGALGGLQGYGQAGAQLPQQQITDFSNIANQGFGQQAQGAQLGLSQAGLGFNQNAAYGANIGWGLGQLQNRSWPAVGWGWGGGSQYGTPLPGSAPIGGAGGGIGMA